MYSNDERMLTKWTTFVLACCVFKCRLRQTNLMYDSETRQWKKDWIKMIKCSITGRHSFKFPGVHSLFKTIFYLNLVFHFLSHKLRCIKDSSVTFSRYLTSLRTMSSFLTESHVTQGFFRFTLPSSPRKMSTNLK